MATEIKAKERVSCGLDVVIAGDLNGVVEESLINFDFVCLPLVHPRYRRDFSNPHLIRNAPLTRSDFLLSSSEWSSLIVAKIPTCTSRLDSADEVSRFNAEKSFSQEVSLAMHLNVPAMMIELRGGECLNLARCLSSLMHTHQSGVVWVRLPMLPRKLLLDDLCCGDHSDSPNDLSNHFTNINSTLNDSTTSSTTPKHTSTLDENTWQWWNRLRTLMGSPPRLRIALELTSDLPSDDQLSQWQGEPVKALVIPTKVFLTNKKGFPVLPTKHQGIIKSLKSDVQIVLSGHLRHSTKSLNHYKTYLNHLFQQRENPDIISAFAKGYEDYLQCPLQPLMDNLESQTYEVFEKDPIKYNNYQKAIYLALMERVVSGDEEVVVMVLGAGRGPLVTATLKAATSSQRRVKVFAVEKNPHAVITLKNLKEEEWGDTVTIVEGDMRSWCCDEKADIIVSELLGSFGDNELSPECLDGAESFLKEDGVSIPCSYTSYVAPVHSSKLWNETKGCRERTKPTGSQFETPYVVRLYNSRLIDQPQPLFTFNHPRSLNPPSELPHSNNRHGRLHFSTPFDTILHGFAGYFHCTLYKHISISIEPSTHTPSMFSWFPIYFPIHHPSFLSKGDKVSVEFWRVVSGKGVWYEWCITSPILSQVHNLDGRSYTIGL